MGAKYAIKWTIDPSDAFDRHADTWRAINAVGHNLPVLDPCYIGALLRHMGAGTERLAIGWLGERPVAACLLTRGKHGSWRTFEAGGCPLGAWVCDAAVPAPDALHALFAALSGPALLIGLTRQDPDLAARPADRGTIRTLNYIETPSIVVAGSFDAFWSARSKGFRQNIRTAMNRKTKQGDAAAALHVIGDAAAVAAAVDLHGLLESASWKQATGNALHPDNAQGAFMREALCGLAQRGETRIYQYRYGDRVVASALCVQRNGALIVLRTSFDEREKFTSPGQVMHYQMLNDIFAAGALSRVEFYGETFQWERQWTGDTRLMYHVNCYRFAWLAALHEALARFSRTG